MTMGVANSPEEAVPNRPFIAFVSEPKEYKASSGQLVKATDIDLVDRVLSMGKLHGAHPGTVAICVGGAAKIAGTVVNEVVNKASLCGDIYFSLL